jgi:hypothetical protein
MNSSEQACAKPSPWVIVRGELDRALAGRFLRNAFMEMQPQAECYVWVGWQSAIAMLGMSD